MGKLSIHWELIAELIQWNPYYSLIAILFQSYVLGLLHLPWLLLIFCVYGCQTKSASCLASYISAQEKIWQLLTYLSNLCKSTEIPWENAFQNFRTHLQFIGEPSLIIHCNVEWRTTYLDTFPALWLGNLSRLSLPHLGTISIKAWAYSWAQRYIRNYS